MSIISKIFEFIFEGIYNGINDIFTICMKFFNEITFDFWDNYIIKGFLAFSMWVNGVVFVLAFVFSLFDAAEEAGSMKQIDWVAVSLNFIKGLLFVSMYSYLSIGIMQIANLLTTYLNLKKDTDLVKVVSNIATNPAANPALTLFINMILTMCVTVALIYFMIISLKRYGTMLIQIFSSAFYVPDIVRGETTKLGDWLRQTIAIAFTYTFQYILFYIGFIIISDSKGIVDVLLGFGLWLSMGGVSQVLSKYGYSSGIKGGSTMVSMASQGLQLLTKH
ncbi:DUF6045 family protein [Paludicola sp. MB14-C6]|uniref:conjugal transfer protein TrbL family protein n=1 Tax=Paludihabitans sp. MB14-C6 TaxID=3070656 RepID=UPI0027DBE0BA|nr:conjugal transfer protein TrbL family protein [Paludicola sp. MB14-C6]WMJ22691.1 DUF6045 family protein [Paludicola sp. MB14-C6]